MALVAAAGVGAATTAVAGTAAKRGRSMPSFSRVPRQMEALKQIVAKHIEDPSLRDIASKDDFTITSTDRGVTTWEHQHMVASLDILNAYQKERRANFGFAGFARNYKHDPRTRVVELLKRWLRNNASKNDMTEDEVRRLSGLCRDVMDHVDLFRSSNRLSFMRAIAGVYEHLDLQLREVLQRDRTCAELAQRVLSLSRNLIADSIGFLLVGPTDLKKTDELPSLEAVDLWKSLPFEAHPLPKRIDKAMQSTMKEVWLTHCGALISGLLRTPWCVRLFEGSGAQDEAAAITATIGNLDGASLVDMPTLLEKIQGEFSSLKHIGRSGLAAVFRKKERQAVREDYLKAVEVLVDLTFLIAEALVQFHRISDGLGDYGMIRVSTWLHPFLGVLMEKVSRLKCCLESINLAVDEHLVVAKAKQQHVEKPAPTQNMSKRARAAIERAVITNGSHAQLLLLAMEELKQRSSPDRLPKVMEGLGDACLQLDAVLASPEFRSCVGVDFPALPRIADVALGAVRNQREIFEIADLSDNEDGRSMPEILDVAEIDAEDTVVSVLRQAAQLQEEQEEHNMIPETSFVITSARDTHGSNVPAISCSSSTEKQGAPVNCFHTSEWPQHLEGSFKSSVKWPIQKEMVHLLVEVTRLATARCGTGFRRHDRRGLRLQGCRLEIFDKGSILQVKTVLDVKRDLEECSLLPGGKIMSLVFRRAPTGVDADVGVWKNKQYLFEFDSKETAMLFNTELCNFETLGV